MITVRQGRVPLSEIPKDCRVGLFFGPPTNSQIKTQRLTIKFECLTLSCACPSSSFNLFLSNLHFASGPFAFLLFYTHTFLLLPCLSDWLAPGISLSSPFLFPFSLEPKFLFLLIVPAWKFCLYLLPHYWLFIFLLDPSGSLSRQGKTTTHLCINKQIHHIFT